MNMTYFYSATTNAFYPEELKQEYINTGSWPDDALVVDDFIYSEYAAQQAPAGKMRAPNDAGYPSWIDIPAPSPEQIIEINTRKYQKLLRTCTDAAFPLQSAITLGIATDEQKALLAELQQYSIDLLSVDLTANPVAFPAPPASLSAA
ncbi:hypothetical protein DLA64_10745 [Salmonella enterica]|nr:hypothetical protein [Salmonella enterica]